MKDRSAFKFSKKTCAWLESYVMQQYEEWKHGRHVWDAQTILSLAYYSGRHYLIYNRASRKLEYLEKRRDDEIRVTLNYTQSKCRTMSARMTSMIPDAEVLQQSSDQEASDGARMATMYLEHSHNANNWQKVYREFANWDIIAGYAWLKTTRNPLIGEELNVFEEEPKCDPETGTVITDPLTGLPEMQTVLELGVPKIKNSFMTGKVEKKVVSPLHLFYDINTKDWDHVNECIERAYEPLSFIRESIPNCDDIQEEESETTDNGYQMMYDTTVDRKGAGWKRGAVILEFWSKARTVPQKPGDPKFPDGIHAILVNGKIRVAEPMPVIRGERLPYSMAGFIPIPGTMRAIGYPEAIASIQQTLNKVFSQILENANDMINLKVWLPDGCQITDYIDDSAGQLITFTGTKPEFPNPPSLPQTHFQIIQACLQAFDDVTGIHKTTEGDMDKEANSAEMVQATTENDSLKHYPQIDSFFEAIADSCKLDLMYTEECTPNEVMLQIVGKNGIPMIKGFRGADIKGQRNVRMAPASKIAQSKLGQKNEIKTMADAGFFNDPDPQKQQMYKMIVMDRMEWGEMKSLMQDVNPDVPLAEWENAQMDEGKQVPNNEWDTDPVHLMIHERRLKAPDFLALDPGTQNLFKQHWAVHRQNYVKAIQLAQQGPAGGPPKPPAPGGPPGGGGPPHPAGPPHPGGPAQPPPMPQRPPLVLPGGPHQVAPPPMPRPNPGQPMPGRPPMPGQPVGPPQGVPPTV